MSLTGTNCNGNKGTFLRVQTGSHNTDAEITGRKVAPKKSSSEILNELFSSLNSKQASSTDSENQTDDKTDNESVITSVRKKHKKRKHKVKKHKKYKSDESSSGNKELNNKVKRKSKKKSKKSKDKHRNDDRVYTCNSNSPKDEEIDLTNISNFDDMAEENTSVNVVDYVATENRIGIELRNNVESQDGSNNALAADVKSPTVVEKSRSRSSSSSSSIISNHDKSDDDKIQKISSSESEIGRNDHRSISRDHSRNRRRSSSRKRPSHINEKRKHTPRRSPIYRNRSKDRHLSRNRSASRHRSRSYTKRRYRSRSCSKARHKSRNSSKNRRSRSYSRSRRRSRSLLKRRRRSRTSSVHKGRRRSRSPSVRRSRYKIRSKSRHRSKSLTRFRSRSRQQSRTKEYRTRRRSKSRSRSKSRYRRREQDAARRSTRSRSRPRYQPAEIRSSSHNRNDEPKIDKQKLLEIARKNAITMLEQGALPESIPPIAKEKVALIKSGGKTVDELTDFCKQLSKKETSSPDNTNDDNCLQRKYEDSGDETDKVFHHPFQVKDKPLNIVMNIRNSVQLPTKTAQEKTTELSKQLRLQFPVSSGEQHRDKQSEWVDVDKQSTADSTNAFQSNESAFNVANFDVSTAVATRLDAIRQLNENSNNATAMATVQKVDHQIKMWAESKQELGKFTGSTCTKILTPAELSSGRQAWVMKNQLKSANPISGGFGMKLLQKMGWQPGQGLGKYQQGAVTPYEVDIKVDKRGLMSQSDMSIPPLPRSVKSASVKVITMPTTTTATSNTSSRIILPTNPSGELQSKHPVSVLTEYCSRKKLGPPVYDFDERVEHGKRQYLFKVTIQGMQYTAPNYCTNKKQGKYEVALFSLQQLGILPTTAKS